jgi:hypothetical protein
MGYRRLNCGKNLSAIYGSDSWHVAIFPGVSTESTYRFIITTTGSAAVGFRQFGRRQFMKLFVGADTADGSVVMDDARSIALPEDIDLVRWEIPRSDRHRSRATQGIPACLAPYVTFEMIATLDEMHECRSSRASDP